MIKKVERVTVPVRMTTDKIALLNISPDTEGVWVKLTACMLNGDMTEASIHKPYFDKLLKEAQVKFQNRKEVA